MPRRPRRPPWTGKPRAGERHGQRAGVGHGGQRLRKRGRPFAPQELASEQHACIDFRDPETGRAYPWKFHRKRQRITVQTWPDEHFPLYALHPSRRHRPAKTRVFLDFVEALLAR